MATVCAAEFLTLFWCCSVFYFLTGLMDCSLKSQNTFSQDFVIAILDETKLKV